jgi:ADP-ribose pyrophosphatase YjhB (NUDIX family)
MISSQNEFRVDIFALLDELRAIAQNGLFYTSDPFDHERYERLMKLTTQTYAELLEVPDATIRARLFQELAPITPKVGADAAIFNDQGEILLMKRFDGSGWCLPCGFVEQNEKTNEAVVRETREETGLEVKVKKLVGVFTRKPNVKNGPHTTIGIVYLCEIIGGKMRLSHEGLDLRFWSIDDVQDWHPSHEKYARAAYAMWRSAEILPAVFE